MMDTLDLVQEFDVPEYVMPAGYDVRQFKLDIIRHFQQGWFDAAKNLYERFQVANETIEVEPLEAYAVKALKLSHNEDNAAEILAWIFMRCCFYYVPLAVRTEALLLLCKYQSTEKRSLNLIKDFMREAEGVIFSLEHSNEYESIRPAAKMLQELKEIVA